MSKEIIKRETHEVASTPTSVQPIVNLDINTGGAHNKVNAFVNKQVVHNNTNIVINDSGVGDAVKFIAEGMTVKKGQFDNTFTKIDPVIWLQLPNNSSANLFVLRTENREYCKDMLTRFIKSNFANYLFTRARLKKYADDDDISSMLSDAKDILREHPEINKENLFEEMMIYSFLECALNAPKIMTSYQLRKSSGKSHSTSIHLLPLSNSIQLVFGTSKAYNSLFQTIDDSFDQVVRIKENKTNEILVYDNAIDDTGFSDKDIQRIVSSIVPSESDSKIKKESAFGMFISYSIDTSFFEDVDNATFNLKLNEKANQDIREIQQYLETKIKELKLSGYQFYIYILPLNNAELEKKQIIKDALGEF